MSKGPHSAEAQKHLTEFLYLRQVPERALTSASLPFIFELYFNSNFHATTWR